MGQYEAAQSSILCARAADRLNPLRRAEADYALARLQQAQGDDALAAATLRSALSEDRRTHYSALERLHRGLMLERLGVLQRRLGNDAEALQTFQKLLALRGSHAGGVYVEIARTYENEQRRNAALRLLATAVQRYPQDMNLRFNYATRLAAAGEVSAAVAQIQAVQTQANSPSEALLLKLAEAEVQESAHRWPAATAAAHAAQKLAQTPAQRANALFLLGDIANRQKQYGAAEQAFRHALALEPNNAAIMNDFAYLLAERRQNLSEALGYAQAAVTQAGDNGAYLDTLGWVFYRLGRWRQAVTRLQQAALWRRHDPVVLDHLAQAELRVGNRQAAAANWQAALANWRQAPALEYDAQAVGAIQRRLAKLRRRLARPSRTR